MGHNYFNSLNYSLANEDTTLEYELVKSLKPKKIFSITGSGGRFTPLIQNGVEKLFYVDMCKEQLWLAELKIQSYVEFTFEEFLKFWAFAPYHEDEWQEIRRSLFSRLHLSPECQSYFQTLFEEKKWGTLLYEGKWEKTFGTLYKINRFVLGKSLGKIFFCPTLKEQQKFYETQFPKRRWNWVIRLLGNKKVFDALLYKGHFVKKNVPESYFEYYHKAFNHLFTKGLVRESFFMNLCFFGKVVFPEGNTIDAQESVFKEIKSVLQQKNLELKSLNQDLISAAQSLKGENVDFASLSDVPSYFTGELERDYLKLVSSMLKTGAIVVLRYYLRIAEADENFYEDVTSQYKELIEKEKVQMYRIKILRFKGGA